MPIPEKYETLWGEGVGSILLEQDLKNLMNKDCRNCETEAA